MKVKKYLNQEINGFLILDTYKKITANGKPTRKVLVRCTRCGREIERGSSVDFQHLKCKCMCAPEPKHHEKIIFHDIEYQKTEFCNLHNISTTTLNNRLKMGLTLEQAVQNEWEKQCKCCGKWFKTDRLSKRYCSNTCYIRGTGHKKPYHQIEMKNCVVCNTVFVAQFKTCNTCSKDCRQQLARIERKGRYKHLKDNNLFDRSVTLKNVFDKYNGVCQGCGKKLTFESDVVGDDYPSIDHIKPISKGGTHEWNNVQLLCRKCNYIKSDKSITYKLKN